MEKARKNHKKVNAGFSLLEMMVVLAIIIIVTAVVLSSLPSFRDNISIDLVASQVATIIREGQVYGVAQKQATAPAGSANISYGLRLVPGTKSFFLYGDTDGNDIMTSDAEKEQEYSLPGDIVISNVSGDDQVSRTIDVLFPRRYPEPQFWICVGPTSSCQLQSSFVIIQLHSDRLNRDKLVKIWKNGQISTANK